MFQQPGNPGPFKVYNVPGVTEMPLGKSASNLQAGELFKIERGQIMSIEAMGAQLARRIASPAAELDMPITALKGIRLHALWPIAVRAAIWRGRIGDFLG